MERLATASGAENNALIAIRPRLQQQQQQQQDASSSPSSSSSFSSSSSSSSTRTATRLQFINTAHPDETNSAQSLSQIRSHVAKEAHARRRQQRKATREAAAAAAAAAAATTAAVLATATGPGASSDCASASSVSSVSSPEGGGDSSSVDDGGGQQQRRRRQQQHEAGQPCTTTTAASTTMAAAVSSAAERQGLAGIAGIDAAATVHALACLPHPRQMIGDAQKDACQGAFAWTLSKQEVKLFDYYLEWVLKCAYTDCTPAHVTPLFVKAMTTTYVPFAIHHPGLLAGIFYSACRWYGFNADDPEVASEYALKTLRYRLACLAMMKAAVAEEVVPSDATISLAMFLTTEAYYEGDIQTSRAHSGAIAKMVSARGGLRSLGLQGLLEYLLTITIYNPSYKLIPGPSIPGFAKALPVYDVN